MPGGTDSSNHAVLSPDEAFALLGNETRIRILRTLAEAEATLSFTELRNQVGIRQGEQFNYHLDKLVGFFVRKTPAGYALSQTGHRVIEAVLSGVVTEDPVLELTRVDGWSCPYCGGGVEVKYRQERVERYCTECDGFLGEAADLDDRGSLGFLYLPPAGVQGRTASEVLDAAFTWAYAEWLVAARGVCPRCSAPVDHSLSVCENHDPGDSFCNRCGERHAARFRASCTNCVFRLGSIMSMYLAASTELLAFVANHGINPLSDPWDWGWEYDEEIRSTEPFEADFTFEIDGDSITLTVDENLTVVDVTGRHGFEAE
jgi:DNA-binding transcriptional ArsR family regulator